MTVFDHIRTHLLQKAKIVPYSQLAHYDSLAKSEWSSQFERLMRQRLIMGALRYGPIHGAGKPKYNRCKSIEKHLNLYQTTGNLEHLVDLANMALMEFEEGTHPLRHFHAVDEHTHHATSS